MQFIERLVALGPRPRVNLTRHHGVLAPNYKYRKQIVPQPKIEPDLKIVESTEEGSEKPSPKKRMKWAQALKRVFDIEIETCIQCGGKVKIIATIESHGHASAYGVRGGRAGCDQEDPLDHLGLNSSPPRWAPARGPPSEAQPELFDYEFSQTPPEY